MKIEDINSPEGVEAYIEGCLNDYSFGISTKKQTISNLIGLNIFLLTKAKKATQEYWQKELELLKKS